MENSATWGKLEQVIYEALENAYIDHGRAKIGLSTTRQVADALRQENLVNDFEGSPLVLVCGDGPVDVFGPIDPSEYSWVEENMSNCNGLEWVELEKFDKENPPF